MKIRAAEQCSQSPENFVVLHCEIRRLRTEWFYLPIRARSLTSPSQGMAGMAWHGAAWHGMVWRGGTARRMCAKLRTLFFFIRNTPSKHHTYKSTGFRVQSTALDAP